MIKVCEVCNGTKFGHYDDYGWEYDYCMICNTAYDEEGNRLPEGEPLEFDPDAPDHERP